MAAPTSFKKRIEAPEIVITPSSPSSAIKQTKKLKQIDELERFIYKTKFGHDRSLLKHTIGKLSLQPSEEGKTIKQYCKKVFLSAAASLRNKVEIRQRAKEHVAKCIFLATQNKEKTAVLVRDPDASALINQDFDAALNDMDERIQNTINLQKNLKIQTIELVQQQILQKEIAKAILTPCGKINTGMIDAILKKFLSPPSLTVEWRAQLAERLKKLKSTPSLQSMIENEKKPEKSNVKSEDIIRISLNLSPNEPTSHYHYKLVLLTGILSDLRQGPVGNCFVMCLAILLFQKLLGQCLADTSQILQIGEMQRRSDNELFHYPFTLSIGDSDTSTSFLLKPNGELESGHFIFESPGFQSACRQLLLLDEKGSAEQAIRHACELLFKNEQVEREITPSQLIEVLVGISPRNKDEEPDYLRKLALVAFSNETHTPILHAWESCMAAMDETKKKDYLPQKMNNMWRTTFKPVWKDKELDSSLIKKIQDAYLSILSKYFVYIYDEAVPTGKVAGDGSSTQGNYLPHTLLTGENLEDTLQHEVPSQKAKAIDSPEDLVEYALKGVRVMDLTFKKQLNENESQPFLLAKDKIVNFVTKKNPEGKNVFLPSLLNNFDSSIKPIKSLNKKFEQWLSIGAIGGDNANVIRNELGLTSFEPIKIRGDLPYERLINFIQILRDTKDEGLLYEMDTSTHALTVEGNNPTIKPFVQSSEDIREMIDKYIIQPGEQICESPITESQKNQLLTYLIENSYLISGDAYLIDEFIKNIKKEATNDPTINAFTKAIVKALLKLNLNVSREQLEAHVSNYVIGVLDEQQLNNFNSTAVFISDTNWFETGKVSKTSEEEEKEKSLETDVLKIKFAWNINFAHRGKEDILAFYTMSEERTSLYDLDLNDWFGPNDKEWNVYPIDVAKLS